MSAREHVRFDQVSPAIPMLILGTVGVVLLALPRVCRRLFMRVDEGLVDLGPHVAATSAAIAGSDGIIDALNARAAVMAMDIRDGAAEGAAVLGPQIARLRQLIQDLPGQIGEELAP